MSVMEVCSVTRTKLDDFTPASFTVLALLPCGTLAEPERENCVLPSTESAVPMAEDALTPVPDALSWSCSDGLLRPIVTSAPPMSRSQPDAQRIPAPPWGSMSGEASRLTTRARPRGEGEAAKRTHLQTVLPGRDGCLRRAAR